MAKDILKSIKKCDVIFSNGQDVLVGGVHLWLFRADGEFVKKVLPIRWPCKAVFIPNRTALVEGAGDCAYYYLDLKTGEILWITKKKLRRSGETNRFVVSPDGSTVYNLFYAYQGKTMCLHAERIIPAMHTHDIFPVKEPLNLTEGGLCITADLFCDSEGTLCALFHKNITRYEDYDYPETPKAIIHYGILALPFQGAAPRPYWKQHWQAEQAERYNPIRACDGRYILREDLSVFDMESQNSFFLVSESERQSLPPCCFRYFYDPERFLLTLWRLDDGQNVVIDCKSRKLLGRYLRENGIDAPGYGGCLVGNEFWRGTPDSVVRYPFPNV